MWDRSLGDLDTDVRRVGRGGEEEWGRIWWCAGILLRSEHQDR